VSEIAAQMEKLLRRLLPEQIYSDWGCTGDHRVVMSTLAGPTYLP
jgi:hypothetical protein